MGDLVHRTPEQSKNAWTHTIAVGLKTADKFIAVAIQLALILYLINKLQLVESPAFYNGFAVLIFVGFVIHHLLPLKWRLPFFFLLTIAGIGLVFGLTQGLWLVILSLLLIAIAHLPINFNARLALLALAGLVLGLARADIFPVPWSAAIWPILGSMFMFRMMFYLHYLRHQKKPVELWATLSYFFLLPNIIFPLFPIVDFGAYRRNYYKDDAHQIYQRGVFWMALGVLQLILYRYVNLYLTLAPIEVFNIVSLLQYFVTDFLLILRVLGQFHLVVGILHLFGFDLPRIFLYIFLSSSFSDFWRRANIYWKDFVVKLFFNPVYFRLRKKGPMVPLVVATIVVFILTWFLHSYQWFWLRGSFLFTAPDILFWILLGSFALINSIREQKRRPAPGLLGQGLRITGTFAAMTILWSLWNSPSLTDWTTLLTLTQPFEFETSELLRLIAILTPLVLGLIIVLVGKHFENHSKVEFWVEKIKTTSYRPYINIAATTVGILGMIAFFERPVYMRFGPEAARTIISLSTPSLSRRDDLMLTRGYYEELANVNRFNTTVGNIVLDQPPDWLTLGQVRAIRLRDDTLEYELIPNLEIYYKRAAFSTNSLGFRDQEYTMIKPDNTCRMVMFGASISMGAGVTNREIFESLVEERLNEERLLGKDVEILNFSVGGFHPINRLASLEYQALPYNPDVTIFVTHPRNELQGDYIVEFIRKGIDFPPEIQQILDDAGINEGMTDAVLLKEVQTIHDDILTAIYTLFTQESLANDALPIMLLIPRVDGVSREEVEHVITLAETAGFIIVDLDGVYEGHEPSDLWLATWDHHPNDVAHALIADRLYEELETNPALATLCNP